jgi:2-methylisocitrate lyase-like PEP mutase family enzyme
MLHEGGCFTLPNPWDIGSARLLQGFGFAALATTSSGFAWTEGKPDYAVDRDEVLHHLESMCRAVDLPINADFESGFASEPEQLSENVKLAIATGVAGLSIEDRDVDDIASLYSTAQSVERIRTAKAAIAETREDVVLVARTEILLIEPQSVKSAIDKLVAFADAGADCLYAPGVAKAEDISTMVKAVAPKPVNVLVLSRDWTVAKLADLGVRRISVGGALAQVGWKAILDAAVSIHDGHFDKLTDGSIGKRLNNTFMSFDGL